MSESDVERAEQALGGPLPGPLRARLLRTNGGEVDVAGDVFELFTVLDHSDRRRFARTSATDIVRENASLREWPKFPPNAVALGHNGCGDVIVVLRDADPYGEELFVWEHETGNLLPGGPATRLE